MRLIIAFVFSVFSGCALAQPMSAEYRSEILELLELSGAMRLGDQVGNLLSQQVINNINAQKSGMPPRIAEVVRQVTDEHMDRFMSDPATIDGMVDLYARHFTQDEVRAIIDFYETPAGEKMRSEIPALTAEAMQFAQGRMASVLPALQQDLVKRLQTEGFAAETGAAPGQ